VDVSLAYTPHPHTLTHSSTPSPLLLADVIYGHSHISSYASKSVAMSVCQLEHKYLLTVKIKGKQILILYNEIIFAINYHLTKTFYLFDEKDKIIFLRMRELRTFS